MTAERTEWAEVAPRMREVSHGHPEHDPRAWHWFARGPILAADGGERRDARRSSSEPRSDGGERTDGSRTSSDRRPDGGERRDGRRSSPDRDADTGRARDDRSRRERHVEDERLRDVSHTPVHGQGANRVWERGEDGDEAEGE